MSVPIDEVIARNLVQLGNGIIKLRVFNTFGSIQRTHGLDFFRVCMDALHDDLFACAHRVFDSHRKAASFWLIRRTLPDQFEQAVLEAGADMDAIGKIADKLKPSVISAISIKTSSLFSIPIQFGSTLHLRATKSS